MVLTERQYNALDWATLNWEPFSYFESPLKEKKTDLVASVNLKKDPKQKLRIIFLIEHKSYKEPDLMRQIAEYQVRIYARQEQDKTQRRAPVFPLLVYHGSQKAWNVPLQFRDYYTDGWPAEVLQIFGDYFMNFTYRVVNLRDAEVQRQLAKLVSAPILFILGEVWNMSDATVAKLHRMGVRLGAEDRKYLMSRAIDYVTQYDEEFTLERIAQIERQTLKEDELIMPMFQGILEREREGLIQQGMERGIQQKGEEIAAEMIREGMGDSAVCRITRLAAERVAEIRRSVSS